MKKILSGNEAVARGLYEANVKFISSYPGFSGAKITEFAEKYDTIKTEYAPNEKTSVEAAFGASLAGARVFCEMTSTGLNVASDPLFSASYIGVNGGMVIAVTDDPGIHFSQSEQDSRHFAIASKIPMLEPSDSQECKDFTKLAYELSEKYDTPVIIRLTHKISESYSKLELSNPIQNELLSYTKNPQKNIMLPENARKKHNIIEDRILMLTALAEKSEINKIEINDTSIGIITSGICYQYAKEVFGNNASYLKLGIVNPLPDDLIKIFKQKIDKIYVIEELDDIIETHCEKIGVNVTGKEIFPVCGEFSQELIKKIILEKNPEYLDLNMTVPNRPHIMCCGCPHRGLMYSLKKLNLFVSGDSGCSMLNAFAPFSIIDSSLCVGGSVSSLHGFNNIKGKDSEKKSVAVIDALAFIHSGISGLINTVCNNTNSLTIILDALTPEQKNKYKTALIDLKSLCHSIGIADVKEINPYDIKNTIDTISEELNKDCPSVIISKGSCALNQNKKATYFIDSDKCTGCKDCLAVYCPAISLKDPKAVIDDVQCTGCNICAEVCPDSAIKRRNINE